LDLNFVANHGGEIIEIGFGKNVKIFKTEQYEEFVKDNYSKSKAKRC
jgi:CRISPR-associated endonuclease Csn1